MAAAFSSVLLFENNQLSGDNAILACPEMFYSLLQLQYILASKYTAFVVSASQHYLKLCSILMSLMCNVNAVLLNSVFYASGCNQVLICVVFASFWHVVLCYFVLNVRCLSLFAIFPHISQFCG